MDNPTTTSTLPLKVSQRKRKGKILKQIDRDLQVIGSGPLGAKRLIINIAIDFQESDPSLSWEDAGKMACGYFQRLHGDGVSGGGACK
jgi:hypothetical protein